MYIKQWYEIIDKMNNSNTYKLAWGRSIVEYIVSTKEDNDLVISFDSLSELMLKYYWNQMFFFELEQSPPGAKKAGMQSVTEHLIELYINYTNLNYPIWFDKCSLIFKEHQEEYNNSINKISNYAKQDVCHRFMNVKGKVNEVYILDKKNRTISFTKEQVKEIREKSDILFKLLNYKWAELLEKYNNTPRIIAKVKGFSNSNIKRSSLTKFRNILLTEFENSKPTCFYTKEALELDNISIDHVIPWSYIYSDDLWNLVVTSKSKNSSKGNSKPGQEDIERLKERNKKLLSVLKDKKVVENLKFGIDTNQVDKFFINMKG